MAFTRLSQSIKTLFFDLVFYILTLYIFKRHYVFKQIKSQLILHTRNFNWFISLGHDYTV